MPSVQVSAGMNGKLANVIKEMCNNRSLNFDARAGAFSDRVRRQLLIMDEVDGMSGACACAGAHEAHNFVVLMVEDVTDSKERMRQQWGGEGCTVPWHRVMAQCDGTG